MGYMESSKKRLEEYISRLEKRTGMKWEIISFKTGTTYLRAKIMSEKGDLRTMVDVSAGWQKA